MRHDISKTILCSLHGISHVSQRYIEWDADVELQHTMKCNFFSRRYNENRTYFSHQRFC